ncbi:ImmA/IrrE family metallo-endopeptidase [Alteromonas abrolhosensis]|uniref:ImmA/IrrE family metallo-endopeptidase n=1 Tax=Alteromonas abrolhosensis TaxID=1892904 RepID=UPI003515168A
MIRKQGHKVPPLSTAKIRGIANKLRCIFDTLSDRSQLKFDVLAAIEFHLPTISSDYSYVIVEDQSLGDDHAQTFPDKNLIKIKQSTYDGALRGSGRDRFTLAHEIGHLFLHKNISSFARSSSPSTKHKAFEDSEWQADCFAAELLMPFDDVRRCTSALEVQFKFGVSLQAAEVRWNKVRSEIEENK